MTTTNYTDYPFTAQGVKFISRVYNNAPLANKIASLPAEVFAQLNIDAVTEIIGDASLLTHTELVNELKRVNEGGSTAFILLDEVAN
jgi:hypothetical protein